MDFRKQGFKKADELQRGYELFLFGGGRGMSLNLHFCLLPLRGTVTLLSPANCSDSPAWRCHQECGRMIVPAQQIERADNSDEESFG